MTRPDRTILKLSLGISFAIVLIVPTLHKAVNRPTDPAMCATCHSMESSTQALNASAHKDIGCAQCHLPEAHFSQLATLITDANCSNIACHPKAEFYNKRFLVSEKNGFDHSVHYEAAVTGGAMTCITCHAHGKDGEHFSTVTNNCFSCHHQDEEVALSISCESCHDASVRFLFDENNDRREPSPHARAAISCAECHRFDKAWGTFLDVRPTCIECHKKTPLKGELYDAWGETLASNATWMAAKITELENASNRSPEANQRLEKLRETYRLLQREGMHNIHATLQMYENIQKELSDNNENQRSD